jgi:hypothetical protein
VCSLSGHFLQRCQAAMHNVVITVFDSVNVTTGDRFNFASWPLRHGMKPIVLNERLVIGCSRARVAVILRGKRSARACENHDPNSGSRLPCFLCFSLSFAISASLVRPIASHCPKKKLCTGLPREGTLPRLSGREHWGEIFAYQMTTVLTGQPASGAHQ